MRCSDNHYYIVKFRNNPQHPRVLANELLATLLAELIGLPVPVPAVVEVGELLIKRTPELHIQLAHSTVPCQPGLQFGSRYAVSPLEGQVLDYFPMEMIHRVRNVDAFAGMLTVDKWTSNADYRQAAFWKKSRQKNYTVAFIDQGNCFNAGEWAFPDHPLRGVYAQNDVYEGVRGWEAFEPWLSRIENMDGSAVGSLADEIPSEWYLGQRKDLERLVRTLIERRGLVPSLIESFRMSSRNPFPNWQPAIEDSNPVSSAKTA